MSVVEDILKCPLTYQLFEDPVLAADGHTYERKAIEEWIRTHGTSPLTREPLSIEQIHSNRLVKTLISNFEKILNQKNYQFTLGADVKKKAGRPIFQAPGKTISRAEWLPNSENRPEIILLKIDGARANREASFYVDLTRHPQIVRTFGFVKDPNARDDNQAILLLQEYASEGSLFELLQDQTTAPPEKVLIQIFLQIIEGMICLTTNHVVHGDLACRNVLVFKYDENEPEKNVVKITDFGLSHHSRLYSRTSASARTTLNIIPIRYAAPEVIVPNAKADSLTEKSDVFSMGVLMWEAYFQGSIPWGEIEQDSEVIRQVKGGAVLQQPSNCSPEYWSIMLKTWAPKPDDRPTFSELKQMLSKRYYQTNDDLWFETFMSQTLKEYQNDELEKALRTTNYLQTPWGDDEKLLHRQDIAIVIRELIENSTKNNVLLNLSYQSIGDQGMRLLSMALKKNRKSPVTRLILGRNDLTDLDVEYLAEMLKVNTTLLDLDLSVNNLTDKAVRLLVDVLVKDNRTLTTLILRGNMHITDNSVEPLCRVMKYNREFRELGIYGCGLSQDGLERLRNVANKYNSYLVGWRN